MSLSKSYFPLLRLPAELRELIYLKTLSPVENKQYTGDGHEIYRYDLDLLLVNRQLYYEARKIFRENNQFISIVTPWPEAQQYVKIQGFVPIIVVGDRAKRFKNWHLGITIDAPNHQMEGQDLQRFVILISDLERFCKMWFYSDMGYPGLNAHLRLTLKLQDPYAQPFDPRTVSKALQKRLLEPFGVVRGLHEVRIIGEHYQSIEKSMRDAMAIGHTPPAACLEEAARLKSEGNNALQAKRYQEAIELYEQSFLAMHIVCEGRRRTVWADAFFQSEILKGAYKGQYGNMVRLMLRVQLVANIILAYLNLENYEEARFWGQRTIDLVSNAVGGGDEPLPDFVAPKEMGKIYFRTAKAYKAQANFVHAKRYLKTAKGYLTHEHDQKQIEDEIEACHAAESEAIPSL
ncbi:hypothetical protein MMC10_006910 [Thelotrema lepadinum]|nr:hypothetical protein [Thelotrema lepadinum]